MSVVRERRDGDMGAVTFGEIIEMTAAVRRASIARVATPRPGWSTPRAASGLELPASSVMGAFSERRTQPDRSKQGVLSSRRGESPHVIKLRRQSLWCVFHKW